MGAVEGYIGNVNINNPTGLNQTFMAGVAGALGGGYANRGSQIPRGQNPLVGPMGMGALRGGLAGLAGGLTQDVANGLIDENNKTECDCKK